MEEKKKKMRIDYDINEETKASYQKELDSIKNPITSESLNEAGWVHKSTASDGGTQHFVYGDYIKGSQAWISLRFSGSNFYHKTRCSSKFFGIAIETVYCYPEIQAATRAARKAGKKYEFDDKGKIINDDEDWFKETDIFNGEIKEMDEFLSVSKDLLAIHLPLIEKHNHECRGIVLTNTLGV